MTTLQLDHTLYSKFAASTADYGAVISSLERTAADRLARNWLKDVQTFFRLEDITADDVATVVWQQGETWLIARHEHPDALLDGFGRSFRATWLVAVPRRHERELRCHPALLWLLADPQTPSPPERFEESPALRIEFNPAHADADGLRTLALGAISDISYDRLRFAAILDAVVRGEQVVISEDEPEIVVSALLACVPPDFGRTLTVAISTTQPKLTSVDLLAISGGESDRFDVDTPLAEYPDFAQSVTRLLFPSDGSEPELDAVVEYVENHTVYEAIRLLADDAGDVGPA